MRGGWERWRPPVMPSIWSKRGHRRTLCHRPQATRPPCKHARAPRKKGCAHLAAKGAGDVAGNKGDEQPRQEEGGGEDLGWDGMG